METLDGDNGLYDSKNQKAKRDLFQFVPYRSFENNPIALTQ